MRSLERSPRGRHHPAVRRRAAEHQTVVLLGKPDEGGGVSVIIDGELPPAELASTLALLAGAAGPGSPVVAATITPDPPRSPSTSSRAGTSSTPQSRSAARCCASGSWSAAAPRSRSASGRGWRRAGRQRKISASAARAADGHRLELFGDDVDHAFVLLEPAADRAAPARPGHPAVTNPTALRAHDVDEPGLVFEVDERDALRGRRTLAMGHDAADEHLLAVVDGQRARSQA